MSTLEEDGITTDRLLELCRQRITRWEKAEARSHTEHEQAEAFTRAFAELDAALRDGGRLPLEWAKAKDALLSADTPDEAGYDLPPTGSMLRERYGTDTVLLPGKHPSDGESKA